jgi:hypothetical protein
MCWYKKTIFGPCKHSAFGERVGICSVAYDLALQRSNRICKFQTSYALHTIRVQIECAKCRAMSDKIARAKRVLRELRGNLERQSDTLELLTATEVEEPFGELDALAAEEWEEFDRGRRRDGHDPVRLQAYCLSSEANILFFGPR